MAELGRLAWDRAPLTLSDQSVTARTSYACRKHTTGVTCYSCTTCVALSVRTFLSNHPSVKTVVGATVQRACSNIPLSTTLVSTSLFRGTLVKDDIITVNKGASCSPKVIVMHSRLISWGRNVYLAGIVLALVLVIPTVSFPFQLTKLAVFALCALVAAASSPWRRYRELTHSRGFKATLLVALLPLAYLLSARLAVDPSVAFAGFGIETDTALFAILAFIAFILSFTFFRTLRTERMLSYRSFRCSGCGGAVPTFFHYRSAYPSRHLPTVR